MELLNQWWGALRENKSNKLNYTLIPPYMLARLANRYTEWWNAHWNWNWLKWDKKYMNMCKESAYRHFTARIAWCEEEDHASATVRNIFAYETLKDKLDGKLDWYLKEKLQDMIDLDNNIDNE